MKKTISTVLTLLLLGGLLALAIYNYRDNPKPLCFALGAGLFSGIAANACFGNRFYHYNGILGGLLVGLLMVLI